VAGNRTFTFSDGSETITMTPGGDGASGNGITHIDSDLAEMVSFVNPTASLTINTDNGGVGADVVVIGELDTPLAGTFATLNVNNGAGNDSVTIAPSADYVILADGGLGTDVFILDLSGGASVDVLDCVANQVTFISGENAILFPNFEGCGPAGLELTLNKSIIYAGDDLAGATVLTITVTNLGPAPAVGAVVDLGNLLTDNAAGALGVVLPATLALAHLAPGASTTIDISGFVTNHNPATYDITVTLLGDTNELNNTAVLASEPGFAFPPKVQINAATYVTHTSTFAGAVVSDSYDKLIVGLFQGAPGIERAVWCKIPNPIVDGVTTLFPVEIGGSTANFGDRWRPCANGLPFPLHVNDIFEDDNNTPLDYSDDTLWLMTWGSAGLYRSDDKGESWTAAAPNATCTSIPTNCLANGNGGNGAWTNVYAMTRGADGFLYISVNDGYVFRSLNDGVTWQQVGSLPEVDADTPWSLVARPTDAGTIYAGTFGVGVYESTDWGFTWHFLGGDVENDVLLGNPLNDPDSVDDLFAGHIFDLETGSIDAGDDFLFAGTGNGIWRYNLSVAPTAGLANSGWEFFGPTVTHGTTDYVPEIRSLAMGPDADVTDGPDFLIGGSWGFGGFSLTDPAIAGASPTAALPIVLRGANVTFAAVAPTTGQAFFGTDTGENITIDVMASTATEDEVSTDLPEGYALGQNYPNPFNPVTTIQFALPESGNVRLAVYDVLGREVAVLVDRTMESGSHGVQFDAQDLNSGTYIYRMTTDKGSFAKQLSLLK
jgi:hypothetical protein